MGKAINMTLTYDDESPADEKLLRIREAINKYVQDTLGSVTFTTTYSYATETIFEPKE
jgi:hypothetical protein